MDLILLVLMIAVIGCIIWAIETYIPMAQPFKLLIRVIVVVVLILYALRFFGVHLPNVIR